MSPLPFAASCSPRLGHILLATHNAGKAREIADLLAPLGIRLSTAADRGLVEPAETGESFAENACIKARAACRAADLAALADDSGLEVMALGGAPGIHSARWAQGSAGRGEGRQGRDFSRAMRLVHDALQARAAPRPWEARFVCALALVLPDGREDVFIGTVQGEIVWPGRGECGFGYDPIFLPGGESLTFGEMEPARKHAISHRADAFGKLSRHL